MTGMIVAPQPEAVEAGAKVLADGGNAYDAALACAFVQFIVDPHSCGVGGYLLLTSQPAWLSEPHSTLDAPALAGSKVSPQMWEKDVIGPNPSGWGFFLKGRVNEDGYLSICIPGAVRGFEAIHSRWCTRPWKELIEPAAELAEVGWRVGSYQAARWKDEAQYYEGAPLHEKLRVTPEAARIYLKPDGSTYGAGETIRNPDYARTLRKLAAEGADDFYTGSLAEDITADLAEHGSFVTPQDFADYEMREETPVITEYRGYTVQSATAPHGGPTLAAILNILEGYDLRSLGHNSPRYIHLVSMAMKAAFTDRNATLADPRFVNVPLEWMTAHDRAQEWRDTIDAGRPFEVPRIQVGAPDTTHVSVVDAQGNCVSLTHSLGSSSGVITPGLGFMYNNSMLNFYPHAGHPNSIAPRKGRTTGMTPTIVSKDGEPMLVIGAPGATRIITAVLSTILNHIDFEMPIVEAVLAPRFDCQGDMIYCQARIPESVCAEVRRQHAIVRLPQSHGGLALVHAVAIDEATGRRSGAADAGAGGMALLVK